MYCNCGVIFNCIYYLAQSGGAASGAGRGSSSNQVSDASLPEAREVRAGGKRFYFDVLQNDRGVFLKLSEVLSFKFANFKFYLLVFLQGADAR